MREGRKRRRKDRRKKYAGILMRLCCLLFLLPLTGNAKGTAGLEVLEKNPVTGEKLAGIELSLYKIAGFSDGDYGTPVYEEAFAEKGEELTALIKADKSQEAVTLIEKSIQTVHVTEYDKKITGEDGKGSFAGLEEGIYLLSCTGNQNTSYRIEQTSVLVSIPMWGSKGELLSDIKLEPKNEIHYPEKQQEISVVKVWKDDNDKAGKRPEKIVVGLYENNQLKEQVELSSKNNWSHEWKNLGKDATYSVTELQVPKGYEMSIENVENRYTITNTYTKKAENPQKKQESEKGKGVKTGDQTKLAVWGMTALLGLTTVCYLSKRKRTE